MVVKACRNINLTKENWKRTNISTVNHQTARDKAMERTLIEAGQKESGLSTVTPEVYALAVKNAHRHTGRKEEDGKWYSSKTA